MLRFLHYAATRSWAGSNFPDSFSDRAITAAVAADCPRTIKSGSIRMDPYEISDTDRQTGTKMIECLSASERSIHTKCYREKIHRLQHPLHFVPAYSNRLFPFEKFEWRRQHYLPFLRKSQHPVIVLKRMMPSTGWCQSHRNRSHGLSWTSLITDV